MKASIALLAALLPIGALVPGAGPAGALPAKGGDRRRRPASRSRNQLAALVSWMGLAVALAVTILVPAGYFVMAAGDVRSDRSSELHLKASRLAKYIAAHGADWQRQATSLSELIEAAEVSDGGIHQRLLDAAGTLVLETGSAPAFPATTTSAPIAVDGAAVGRIEASDTLRGALVQTGIVAAQCAALGFAMYFALRLLPMRVIDRVIGDLEAQTVRFETTLDNMERAICMFDADRRLIVCNNQYATLFGLPAEKIVLGMTEPEVQALSTDTNSSAELDSTGEWSIFEDRSLLHRADGTVITGYRKPMADGGVVVVYRDITATLAAEAKVFHMARHDALTDLPNRRLFREELDSALKHADDDRTVAVFYLDIDHFRNVNDTLGHPVGDELLKAIGGRLQGAVRASDTVARVGGAEFAIIQTRLPQPINAGVLAGRLLELIGEPFVIDGHPIVVGASIGIALSSTDGSDADQLLKNANLALDRTKEDARGTHRFFEAEMDARVQQRRTFEMNLRRAIGREEFELVYQPIIHIASEAIVGFEALLRWNHPVRGTVSPADFIPVAEETGQIVAIGEWAIRTACTQAVTWPGGLTVAVNLSPLQLKSPNLVAVVADALAVSKLPAACLEIEITESALLQDDARTRRVLQALVDLGASISMDDFGTGFSSLDSLRKFPFHRIKIDQSFVREMAGRGESLAIIRAVSAIGANLGMATTAEGVETREQFELVKKEGCTEAQGYLFGRPTSSKEIPAILANNRHIER